MLAYKVLGRDLSSAVASGNTKVQYKVGEWVRAPRMMAKHGYHLTVFESLEHAQIFQRACIWRGMRIWKVEVPHLYTPNRIPFTIAALGHLSERVVAKYTGRDRGYDHPVTSYWPQGTMFTTRVKLLWEVE